MAPRAFRPLFLALVWVPLGVVLASEIPYVFYHEGVTETFFWRLITPGVILGAIAILFHKAWPLWLRVVSAAAYLCSMSVVLMCAVIVLSLGLGSFRGGNWS